MPKDDVLFVIDSQNSTRNSAGSFVISAGGSGGSGGVGLTELANYLRRDGTSAMLGNLDMGGFSITNVSLLDGIDLPAHVANPDAHHARIHEYDSPDHTGLLPWFKIDFGDSDLFDIQNRPHYALTNITPNDHHNQVHNITGTDHTVTGVAFDVIGLPSNNTLGLLTPSNNPLASQKLLRTDANGLLIIKRLEGGDYVKSAGYLQAATYVQAGSYVSAVTYVDSPILQQAGNISVNSGINIYLNPTGFIALAPDRAIRSNSFISGFAGSGWQIDQNISATGANAEFDNLTIRGRMRVYELIIQQIRATNGSIFVSSVAKIKTVTLVSGDTYEFTSEDYHGFLVNDLIRAQRFTTAGSGGSIYRSDFRVTSIDATTPLYKFRAIRENGSDLPKVGMDFVRLGNTTDTTRQGALYLSSDDSNAPFIDVVNGVNSWAAWTGAAKNKVRIGKISGVTSVANEYGIIAGDTGFGQNDRWMKVSNLGVVLNNVPLQFFNGANQTGFWNNTGTSFWIGPNTTDRRLEWNGTTLNVKGAITVTGGDAAKTSDVSAAQTAAINYTNANAAKLDLSNTTANWAGSNVRGGYANDTNAVWGVAAVTVKDYALRAGAGLNAGGRIVQSVQSPSISDDSAAVGLNLTRNYLGYFNGTYWTMFMTSSGTFRFGSTQFNNRLEWNGTELAGYNNANQLQWYASSADGLIYAGGGYVKIGSFGINAGTYTTLDANGFANQRPSLVYTWTAEPNGPLDTGTYPSLSNSIDLYDSTFYVSDWYGNYMTYYGQSLLRIYTSSKHFVSDDTPFDSDSWEHYLDGVIEVPPMSKPSRTIVVPNYKPPPYDMMGQYVRDYYYPRLILRNVFSSIVIQESQRIEINAGDTYFKLMSNNYTAPADLAWLRVNASIGTQYVISKDNLNLSAGDTGLNTMNLIAYNLNIGNTSSPGTTNFYGVNQMQQWLRLKSWTSDGVYIEFYPRTSNTNYRGAYIGFPDTTTTTLWINNEMGSVIYARATDRFIVSNNLHVGTAVQFTKQTATPAAIPGVVQLYQGGDGNMYFRGPNGYVRITGLTLLSGSFP